MRRTAPQSPRSEISPARRVARLEGLPAAAAPPGGDSHRSLALLAPPEADAPVVPCRADLLGLPASLEARLPVLVTVSSRGFDVRSPALLAPSRRWDGQESRLVRFVPQGTRIGNHVARVSRARFGAIPQKMAASRRSAACARSPSVGPRVRGPSLLDLACGGNRAATDVSGQCEIEWRVTPPQNPS